MFWPQFALRAVAAGLMLAAAPSALAQTAGRPAGPSLSMSGSIAYSRSQTAAVQAKTDAILAAVSAEAGISYSHLPAPPLGTQSTSTDNADPSQARLCVRAGLGLSLPDLAGPQMIVEHGLIGCPTNTGGLPIVVIQDPALQPPPASRAGNYTLDVTLRYRLLQLKHMQVLAVASDQGVGYSLSSPVSGNNLLLGMTLVF